jgi:multiple sugar transport system permease protein
VRERLGARPAWQSVLLHTVVLAGALVMIYPLLWMLSSSLKPSSLIFSDLSLIPSELDFSHYTDGWTALSVSFGRFITNSLVVAALSVTGLVFSSALTAFAFARLEFAGRKLLFGVMLVTIMLPAHALLIPQYLLFTELGWINTYLPLVIPRWFAVDAFFVFLLVQFMRGIPRELDDAARVDGCGPFQLFWHIILPLSKPALVTVAIMSFTWSWDEFLGPLIYLQDPRTFTVPLGLQMFLDASSGSDWGGMFAMSVLALVPPLLLFTIFQRRIIQGIATTGIKG